MDEAPETAMLWLDDALHVQHQKELRERNKVMKIN